MIHSPDPSAPVGEPISFTPVPVSPRRDGWTAERQCLFIEALAETGCVVHAAARAGMSVRSAYRLAARPDGRSFAEAWDVACAIASRHLAAIAYRYATEGMSETVWRDGVLVAERRRPSERLLIYLLSHLDPVRFGRGQAPLAADDPCPRSWPERRLPELLAGLEDIEEAEEAEEAEEPAAQDPLPGQPPRARVEP
jgi:hypothetical protein